ncbi:MAG: hypothetical protein VB087_10780 [Candidatus Limiplasma sp.]|nr:hypothetical protein [Candidatus Limiplasma sp.]MEA5146566.1 hypothetical protein [Candidatus Limiplasma sp.]
MAQIGIRLSDQEKVKLASLAGQSDQTISQILRMLIRKYMMEVANGK